ncbi:MAG: CDP-glycerol glycerophosphotransferase family protein [Sulfurospirillum cavolei]|nr:CDP-glycerol glycerophosphotransferase family protein [Sulfurospirillum cavolei]
MFAKELQQLHGCQFLGFLDNFKEGKGILKPTEIKEDFDYILILSQNHFDAVYKSMENIIPLHKVVKVDIHNGQYIFLNQKAIQQQFYSQYYKKLKNCFFKLCVTLLDRLHYKRKINVFISKSFISSNNKALYIECLRQKLETYMLTDNLAHYNELKQHKLPVVWLGSFYSFWILSQARVIVQDQGNFTYELNTRSPQQILVQLWHGIPLKRLNLLVGITYDYLISTSYFVNQTTLSHVIQAKEYCNDGYPRNDSLLKSSHDTYDLLLCDHTIYSFAKEKFERATIALYMPTHRESHQASCIPLDFVCLNESLAQHNIYLIVKLHPFVMQLYAIKEHQTYSHILFYPTQGDIYPLLKYTHILITDYSSIYFDFLLLNRPIIFFDYDYDEYSSNMNGFVYPYETFAPGIKVKTQNELLSELILTTQEKDNYYEQRKNLIDQLFDYQDAYSAKRIIDHFLKLVYSHTA